MTHKIIKKGVSESNVYIDEDKIRQVISNLLSNAVKYSPKSTKIIATIVENKQTVEIHVQDFGIGIDKHEQVKVFSRFYRSSISRRSTIAGFGLGLYISAEIIKQHKGKLWVTSKPGKGSIFSLKLLKNHHERDTH